MYIYAFKRGIDKEKKKKYNYKCCRGRRPRRPVRTKTIEMLIISNIKRKRGRRKNK